MSTLALISEGERLPARRTRASPVAMSKLRSCGKRARRDMKVQDLTRDVRDREATEPSRQGGSRGACVKLPAPNHTILCSI